MQDNIFLAALPSHEHCTQLTQKISQCETKRSPLLKLQWTHSQDLHVTLGFIKDVNPKDFRTIAFSFLEIAKTAPFMATVADIKIYGTAIVLRLEPAHRFMQLHKKMNTQLMAETHQKYQFLEDKRFDPHITIGRIRNLNAINPQHMHQFHQLVRDAFKSQSLLIQQAALMQRVSEHQAPSYQAIQRYVLKQ